MPLYLLFSRSPQNYGPTCWSAWATTTCSTTPNLLTLGNQVTEWSPDAAAIRVGSDLAVQIVAGRVTGIFGDIKCPSIIIGPRQWVLGKEQWGRTPKPIWFFTHRAYALHTGLVIHAVTHPGLGVRTSLYRWFSFLNNTKGAIFSDTYLHFNKCAYKFFFLFFFIFFLFAVNKKI